MVYKIPPGGGGKPYLASGLIGQDKGHKIIIRGTRFVTEEVISLRRWTK